MGMPHPGCGAGRVGFAVSAAVQSRQWFVEQKQLGLYNKARPKATRCFHRPTTGRDGVQAVAVFPTNRPRFQFKPALLKAKPTIAVKQIVAHRQMRKQLRILEHQPICVLRRHEMARCGIKQGFAVQSMKPFSGRTNPRCNAARWFFPNRRSEHPAYGVSTRSANSRGKFPLSSRMSISSSNKRLPHPEAALEPA